MMEYLPTILVGGILLVVVLLIVRYLAKQVRGGHGICCGDCKSCGHCSALQEAQEHAQEKPSGCSGNCAGCRGNCSGCGKAQ